MSTKKFIRYQNRKLYCPQSHQYVRLPVVAHGILTCGDKVTNQHNKTDATLDTLRQYIAFHVLDHLSEETLRGIAVIPR
jgi:hypothetical protein